MPLGAHKAAIMGVAGVSTGDVVLLSTQNPSDVASVTFSGLMTSTYGEYIFKFYNVECAGTGGPSFGFQVNATDGADFNDSLITSTAFNALHSEDDSPSAYVTYNTGGDLAQAATYQLIATEVGTGADESCSGELHIFNPSSTAYVKHFISKVASVNIGHGADEPAALATHAAGYINDATAIDDINFKWSAGNIASGRIKMWGVKQLWQ